MHSKWDEILTSMNVAHIDKLLGDANKVKPTPGPIVDWPAIWASETVKIAKDEFTGVKFGAKNGKSWPAELPEGYNTKMNDVKKTQLERAGTRLAQVLESIWP
jgi:hypothetical protein